MSNEIVIGPPGESGDSSAEETLQPPDELIRVLLPDDHGRDLVLDRRGDRPEGVGIDRLFDSIRRSPGDEHGVLSHSLRRQPSRASTQRSM